MRRYDRDHADPTFDRAIGSVNKEWINMAKLAIFIREGRCDPTWAEEKMTKFTGIFRRLLEDPIDEIKQQIGV